MIEAAAVLFLLLFLAQPARADQITWRAWVCLFGFAVTSGYIVFRELLQ